MIHYLRSILYLVSPFSESHRTCSGHQASIYKYHKCSHTCTQMMHHIMFMCVCMYDMWKFMCVCAFMIYANAKHHMSESLSSNWLAVSPLSAEDLLAVRRSDETLEVDLALNQLGLHQKRQTNTTRKRDPHREKQIPTQGPQPERKQRQNE